jgi:hypothetical protein
MRLPRFGLSSDIIPESDRQEVSRLAAGVLLKGKQHDEVRLWSDQFRPLERLMRSPGQRETHAELIDALRDTSREKELGRSGRYAPAAVHADPNVT